ncbi:MAG: hypothetical protein QXT22_05245 [Candidatus Hadarchaeales archaeon]
MAKIVQCVRKPGKRAGKCCGCGTLRRRDYWRREWEIFYWKDHRQREVDFVVKEGRRVKQLIQVCREVTPDTKKREVDALLLAMKEFRLKEGLILTFDQEETVDGKRIVYRPIWKWLFRNFLILYQFFSLFMNFVAKISEKCLSEKR